jgi:hypothetical protein
MERNLKSLLFQIEDPLEVFVVLTCGTPDSRRIVPPDRPDGFRRAQTDITKEGINSYRILYRIEIRIIKDRKSEIFSIWPCDSWNHTQPVTYEATGRAPC